MGRISKEISLYCIMVLCEGVHLRVTGSKFMVVFMRRADSACF